VPTTAGQPLLDAGLLAAFEAGLAAAAAACESMSGGQLVVSSSEIGRLTLSEVLESAGGSEVAVVAIYVGFSGPLSGHGVLLLEPDEARSLALTILGELLDGTDEGLPNPDAGGLTPLQRSVVEEVGNVAISGVLSRLGDAVGEAIHPMVPVFVFDMAASVLDAVVSDVAGASDTILAARTMFSQDGRNATGVLLVVPSPRPDAGRSDLS
jgi:chemotaxis protein CheY-P-specific phosphatase CheC